MFRARLAALLPRNFPRLLELFILRCSDRKPTHGPRGRP
jgi:hypothetical protein